MKLVFLPLILLKDLILLQYQMLILLSLILKNELLVCIISMLLMELK